MRNSTGLGTDAEGEGANEVEATDCSSKRSTEFYTALYSAESDDDFQNSTINTYLLFPKEESSSDASQPLFPSASSKKFAITMCGRTLFRCRGLVLFCVLIFMIITFATSYNNNSTVISNQTGENGTILPDPQHPLIEVYLTLPTSVADYGDFNSSRDKIKMKFRSKCGYKRTDFASIANSMWKGLQFYERNLENITVLDAALGGRIIAEQAKMILLRHPKLPIEVRISITKLMAKADTISNQITETVKKSVTSIDTLKYTLPWLETDNLWKLPLNEHWYPVGQMKSFEPPEGESYEDLWSIQFYRKEVIDEAISDKCIYQVFHCHAENVTKQCQGVFLKTENSMYSLTHQVIYMLLARKNNCFDNSIWNNVLEVKDKGESFLETLCGKVWQEANSIVGANFPPRFRDLFAEQIGMCSLAGYPEFLRRSWLFRIMSWQSASTSGCFGERRRRTAPPAILEKFREHQRRKKLIEARALGELLGQESLGNHNHMHSHGRYKRSDVVLEDEMTRDKCSVHFTSVAITALSVHLRYFFDNCLDAY